MTLALFCIYRLIRSPGSFPTAILEISACIMPGNSRNTSKWTFTVPAVVYAAHGRSRKRASTCSTRTTNSISRSKIPTAKTTSRRSSSLTDSGTCDDIYCSFSPLLSLSLLVFTSQSRSLVSAYNSYGEPRYFRCEQRMCVDRPNTLDHFTQGSATFANLCGISNKAVACQLALPNLLYSRNGQKRVLLARY